MVLELPVYEPHDRTLRPTFRRRLFSKYFHKVSLLLVDILQTHSAEAPMTTSNTGFTGLASAASGFLSGLILAPRGHHQRQIPIMKVTWILRHRLRLRGIIESSFFQT